MVGWVLTGNTLPVSDTSPVQAESGRTRRPESSENRAKVKAQPADGPSLATAPAGMCTCRSL